MRIRILLLLVHAALLGGLKAQTGPEIEVLTPAPCVPGQVSLRIKNCSSCTSYEWEIGAGKGYKLAGNSYSTIITDTGWYDVTVKITTASGSTVLISTKKAFYGRPAPAIKYSISQSTFCKGADSVILTDLTTNVVSRDWLIDGKVFYNAPATIKYGLSSLQGYKSIYLLVRDSWGCKSKYLKDSAISVWDSVKASVSTSVTGKCAPTSVNFYATLDTGMQKISSFLWTFQNGSPGTSTSRSPQGIYYATGDTLDTNLKIVTNRGCTYKYAFNNLLNLGDTSFLKISLAKVKVCANEPLQLQVTGAKTSTPTWDVTGVATNEGVQQGTKVTYSFKDTGNPVIGVRESYKGCTSYATFTTKVVVEGPVASVLAESPFYCGYPKTLVFTNNSVAWPGGTSWSWKLWDSKNNLVSSASTKSFSYTTNKGEDYSVYLKATGTNGCADSVLLKKASVYGHIDSNFRVIPNPGCPGKATTLKSNAGPGSPSDPNKFIWTFYDANGNEIHKDQNVTGTYTYQNPGVYSAKMLVYNNSNCKDSLKLIDTIHIVSPSLSVSVKDTFVCTRQSFKAYATYNIKSPSSYLFWTMNNIDSAGGTIYAGGDTASFYLFTTGRYKLSLQIMDTAKNACTFSYTHPANIRASGIQLKVTPTNSYGCIPLTVNLQSSVLHNVSYRVNNPAISYEWKTNSPTGLSFSSLNTANTTASATTEAEHYAYLKYTNASGCKDSLYAALDTRFQAGFYLSNAAHCVGQTGKIINSATKWATNFQYEADPSVIFSPSANVPEPVILFTKPGVWPVRQIISSGNCRDTFINNFDIYDIHADFYTPDSVSYCAPRLVNFINNTSSVLYNYWKFGDGDSAMSMFNDVTGHLYTRNNPRPGFDITLVVENYYGCKDTLTKKAYLRLIGPVPDFTVTNITGCEPLRVTFKNKSTDYSRMLLDYDNGIVLDSSELGYFDYVVTNKALPSQQYLPRLLLIDSLGCSALAESTDTITVLKGPEAKFTFTSISFLRKTEGCANQLLVKFTNQSKFFGRTFWDFNNDDVTDVKNQNAPSYVYDKAGIFYPRLVAEHVNGCRDTFFKDSIVVWDPPVASFTARDDTTCAVDPVKFTYTGSSAYPIIKYNWNFGELPLYDDTATIPSPVWKYSTPFNHNVTLQIEDSKGCKDQVVKNVYVNDTAGPGKPQLAFVTVKDDQYVEFYWRQSKIGNFLQYHVLLDSLGFWEKMNSYNRKDTSFSAFYGAQTANRRFCYTLRVEDTCNQKGIPANSHCTIVLRDTAYEPFNIRLTWLSYDWWGTELDHYEIFRKEKGSNTWVKISTVKNNKLNFTDSFLCDKEYCYYVEAVHKNREYRSRSNTVCRKAIYVKPDSTVKTTLVTVRDNAYPEVRWEPYYKYYRKWSYVLERSPNGSTGSFSTVREVHGTDTLDYAANVHDRANYYRVSFKDHCGVLSEPGVVSNSILLQVNTQNRNSSKLNWNPYGYWFSGVRQYVVQLKDKNGVFGDMAAYSGSTLASDNIDIEKLELDSICFRVYALKDSSTNDTSWSNELCLVPASYLHVPTAFTPDNNNLNEVFKPVTAFIHRGDENPETRYEFKIFNRWGQMVFSTNMPSEGWDGRFKGEMCPGGLYIWKLQAVGFDGAAYRQEGTVYLLR